MQRVPYTFIGEELMHFSVYTKQEKQIGFALVKSN